MEVLKDGTELHPASFCMADGELRLEGTDSRPCTLTCSTGPRRACHRIFDGELAELRAQLVDLLDRCWIQHSTAGHAAAVMFARKPDGSWVIYCA